MSRTLLSLALLGARGRSKWETTPGCGDAELPLLFPEDVKESQSVGTQHLLAVGQSGKLRSETVQQHR